MYDMITICCNKWRSILAKSINTYLILEGEPKQVADIELGDQKTSQESLAKQKGILLSI